MRNFKNLLSYANRENKTYINISLLLNKMIGEEDINRNKKSFLEKVVTKEIIVDNRGEIIDSIKSGLQSSGWKEIYNNVLHTSSPLVCGLGSTHVLETSLTLHHIWGVPYIPGSSLKGVCRQIAFWKLAEQKNKLNDSDDFQKIFYGNLNDNDIDILVYQFLFGAQDFKGLLLFLDAYPDLSDESSKKPFKLDIMNPHYSSYYCDDTGNTVPGDWENPVPIFFLTVKPGVKFRFVILFDDYRWESVKKDGVEIIKCDKKEKIKISDEIKTGIERLSKNNSFLNEILKPALENYGVGSKTRLGYGNFKI